MEDPTKLGDLLPVGFGDVGGGVVDDELAEEGEGRKWNDHGPQWVAKEGKKDRFMSTLTRMVSILLEGKPLFGGLCQKAEIEEVEVRPVDDPKDPEAWEKEIGKEGVGAAYIFSDGSLLETGNVGGGAFVVGTDGEEVEVKVEIGDVAMVWDGEVAGMTGGLKRTKVMREGKVLILADSKAAIAAVKKAGKTGKARTRHLQETVNMIADVKKNGGEVKMG